MVLGVLLVGCGEVAERQGSLSVAPFGVTKFGETAKLYTLKGAGGLELVVSDYGGRLIKCLMLNADGTKTDVTLGWNTIEEYEQNGLSMGTLIGRFGNRIRDGRFTLDGVEYQLPVNETEPAPRHCNLHGGPDGWDTKVWAATPFKGRDGSLGLVLELKSPDGDMGFPGAVKAKVTYTVLPENIWRIDYEATTDKPTVINLTHHTYWNMAGEASGDVRQQELRIWADEYTRTDAGLIPVANVPVDGTGMDFRSPRPIAANAELMRSEKAFAPMDNWYDHNFVLNGTPGELHPAAKLRDPVSRRTLEVWTTEPGMQMYGAQNIGDKGVFKTKTEGVSMVRFAGVALETQHFPDSPNHPEFPSTVLRPGETFRSTTEFRFSFR